MAGNKLSLEYDEDDRAVWLTVESPYGIQQRQAIWLRDEFALEHVQAAILATGRASQNDGEYRLSSDIRCEQLCAIVESILDLFDAPDVPSRQLQDLQTALAEQDIIPSANTDISLYALAWLDVMVREDLADAARGATDIWRKSEISIDVETHCQRRVTELLSRFPHIKAKQFGRLAGSIPTRHTDKSRGKQTG
jgi:hypothetical protein